MTKWENIVKDKLEGYKVSLPDSAFDEYQARLDGTVNSPKTKRFPLVWLITAAVAASLVAVLFIWPEETPKEDIQLVQQPMATSVQIDDSLDVITPISASPLIVQATTSKAVRPSVEPRNETINVEESDVLREEVVSFKEPEENNITKKDDAGPQYSSEEPIVNKSIETDSLPFVPQTIGDNTVKPTVVAGGGLLAALATQYIGPALNTNSSTWPNNNPSEIINIPHDEQVGSPKHQMPLTVGLSVRVPVTDKLDVTTGLDYSRYSTLFTFSLSGGKTQHVNYLGIPVRLDWTFASSRWFDAYMGAGVKGEFCLSATLAGESISNDGPAFRLLGASGIQFNVTRLLGIYVEPEISWTIPSERRILSTYSSEHPWMVSVATGLRIDLGGKRFSHRP